MLYCNGKCQLASDMSPGMATRGDYIDENETCPFQNSSLTYALFDAEVTRGTLALLRKRNVSRSHDNVD